MTAPTAVPQPGDHPHARPYTDADVDTVAKAFAATRGDQCFDFDGPQWNGAREIHRMDARAVLDILADANRQREDHRAAVLRRWECGEIGGGWDWLAERLHAETVAECEHDTQGNPLACYGDEATAILNKLIELGWTPPAEGTQP